MRLERNAVPWPNIAGAAEAELQSDKVALDISRVRREQVIAKCGVREVEMLHAQREDQLRMQECK